jgi:drug/metabolite transporter superfamily protein YnfA
MSPVRKRERLHGLVWLVWRQHRVMAWLLLGAVLLTVGYLVIQRFEFQSDLDAYAARGCAISEGAVNCGGVDNGLYSQEDVWSHLLDLLLLGPLLVGVFAGAASFGGDLESGRHKLLWSQSITPRRWLAYRLALPATAVVLGATAIALTNAWYWDWSRPDFPVTEWWDRTTFGISGPLYPAAALFALLLGAVCGLVLRRVVAAIAATGIGYLVVIMGVNTYVPRLAWPVHTAPGAPGTPESAWLYRLSTVLPWDRGSLVSSYQPASHFWMLEFVEAGTLLLLSAALVAFAFRRARRLSA